MKVVNVRSSLNVRFRAGTWTCGSLGPNQKIQSKGSCRGSWCPISYGGKCQGRGWVHKSYLSGCEDRKASMPATARPAQTEAASTLEEPPASTGSDLPFSLGSPLSAEGRAVAEDFSLAQSEKEKANAAVASRLVRLNREEREPVSGATTPPPSKAVVSTNPNFQFSGLNEAARTSPQDFSLTSESKGESAAAITRVNGVAYSMGITSEDPSKVFYLKGNYYLRSEASKDSKPIEVIGRGAKLTKISCGYSEGRCLVEFQGKRGYIPEEALQSTPPPVSKFMFGPPICGRGFSRISSRFGPRKPPRTKSGKRGSAFHRGIDLAAPIGTPVTSISSGKVVSAGWAGGAGKMVVVQHGKCYRTRYFHLNKIRVKKDARVYSGQRIGDVGMTGNTGGPHLHLEFMDMCKPKRRRHLDPSKKVNFNRKFLTQSCGALARRGQSGSAELDSSESTR